jgi:predicted transposase YdaD
VSALFLVETSDPETLHEKTELILEILKKERPEETRLFTEWLHQHFGETQNTFVDKIDTLQEVRTMLAAALKRKEEEWKRVYLMEGKLEGRRENALSNAKALKKLKVDIAIIAKATGLTREEIEEL